MKKILLATILFTTAGALTSCKKHTTIQVTAAIERSTVANKKDIGQAD